MTVMVTVAIAVMLGLLIVVPLTVQVITAFRGPFLPFGVPTAEWGVTNFVPCGACASRLRGDVLGDDALRRRLDPARAWGSPFGLAWLAARTDLPGRSLVAVLVMVPYIIPPIVKAQAFYLMLSPKTGMAQPAAAVAAVRRRRDGPIDPYSFPVLVVIQALTNVTFPYLLLDADPAEHGRLARGGLARVGGELAETVLG